MNRNNDVVRALGFVAMYAAHVEEGVDEVLGRLSRFEQIPKNAMKWPTSVKIKWCQDQIERLESEQLAHLNGVLSNTLEALGKRNEFIHGRIYVSPDDGVESLVSGRQGVPDREICADELYDFAEELLELQAVIPNLGWIALEKAITEKLTADKTADL